MQPRVIAGILLAVAGLASFGSGGAVFVQALERQSSQTERMTRAEISCQQQLVRLGQVVPREDDIVEVRISAPDSDVGLADPRSAMADATAALAMCPGRELLEACVGVTCGSAEQGPVMLTMRLGLIK